MMAGARDELADAVDQLSESDAELVLSFVHRLRARREQAASSLLSALVREPIDDERGWLSLSERALARDWNRPEEEEAWAGL